MELHSLKPPQGSNKQRKRLGRGPGSGHGKTSGRGHKGQGARAGAKGDFGNEGGQWPLQRRLPKRGFTNIFRIEYQIVNVADLDRCEAGEVTVATMAQVGLIRNPDRPVKLLGNGTVQKAFTVKAQAFSKTATEKIQAAGGKAEVM